MHRRERQNEKTGCLSTLSIPFGVLPHMVDAGNCFTRAISERGYRVGRTSQRTVIIQNPE